MSAGQRTDFDLVEDFWQRLLAVDEAVVDRATRTLARRRTMRTLAFALLTLLAAAAIALAARALLFGEAAPRQLPTIQRHGWGDLRPGSARLLGLRVADPAGGPPWGVRVFRTTRQRRICLQVGRVVHGRLAALGIAGAFHDDGRAHVLPLAGEACGELHGPGTRFAAVSQVTSADGAIRGRPCLAARAVEAIRKGVPYATQVLDDALRRGDPVAIAQARRALRVAHIRQAHVGTPCVAADQRTIVVGTAPAQTAAVVFVSPTASRTQRPAEGLYLFVLPGENAAERAQILARRAHRPDCRLANPGAGPQGNLARWRGVPRCDYAHPH
jgi:hypothetical protein